VKEIAMASDRNITSDLYAESTYVPDDREFYSEQDDQDATVEAGMYLAPVGLLLVGLEWLWEKIVGES
jgi:hypothetical protein